MAVVMASFLVFLLIILQIYNSSLIIENVDVDWTKNCIILINNNLVGLIKILLNYKNLNKLKI
jgi:hypothetical protein